MSSSSNVTAPPPPDDDDSSSSSSPPPPSPSSSSPSPPPPSSQKSPPPSSSDNSPPPPSKNQSPPPPSSNGDNSSSPPPPSGNNNNGSSSSSSPPPPSPSSDDHDDSYSPPPPPSKNNNSPHVPPPPPRSSSSTPSSGALSPPTHSYKSPPSPSDSSNQDEQYKMRIGIGAGVGVGVLLIMFVVCCVCSAKKKKRRKQEAMHYYGPPKGGEQYYNSSQHPGWHNQQGGGDHVVKLPPPPNSMGMPTSGGWPAQPPPPPPMMMSSGEMSSNFSGPHHPPLPPPSPNLALGFNKSTFSYDELAAATGNFSQSNLLGQGGFGYVHKGVFPNGKEVAVKSLKSGSGQGEREFQAEVEIISRVHHRHLVSLVGYCIAGGQRMLVYEFVPNSTLEYHLHGNGRPPMDFPSRLRIALGSAKGLAYLHEDCHPRIIHRDIKAANILLDYNYEAMVADFGLAKLSSENYTHVSTRVMGTFGYLAPEYAASGKLTEKSDVFSFGVMLLELITGKRPVDNTNTMEDSLVDWARPLMASALEDGNYDELVDPRLENNFSPHEMARMVACAAASIRHSARRRPRMSQIVRALEGDASLEDLNEGTRPGQSSAYSSNGSSDYDTGAYNADMIKFKKMALSSQEFSGEYGNTGEYGANSSSGEMGHSGKPKAQY